MAGPAPASRAPAEAIAAPTPSRHRESRRVRTALKVSSPGDSAEREAEATARRVVAMPAPKRLSPISSRMSLMPARAPVVPVPRPQAPAGSAAPPAKAAPPEETSPELEAAIKKELGGGRALPADVAEFMAPRFKANFGGVRIHTGAKAANLATRLGANAFTFGRDIFFNAGAFQPQTPGGMELIAHELTHTIQQREVVQREAAEAAPVQVRETSAPKVQRGIISKALDWIADKANYIPGFRLFTIIIGLNPINMATVERSGANILRALVEFLPGGGLIVEALDGYGIFEKAGGWIEQQFRSLGMVGSAFRDALMAFVDSLGPSDIFSPGAVIDRGIAIFTAPVVKLINFGKSLASGILKFIREAILKPLAALAQGKPGYTLLKAVLGEDPVTGEGVTPTPDMVIGGFMELIGQTEIWENIKKANAIPRAWSWFKTAINGLMTLVRSIPKRFMDTLKSLEIMDLVLPYKAFIKVGAAFASFYGDFFSWALGTILALLQIIFEVVAPAAVPYIKKAAGAFNTILKNPMAFVRTLVAAGKLGFSQFAKNFLKHLQASLVAWLTGAMSGAGVYIPAGFSLIEILKFVLSVLGLTWANIRGKLVKATNETVVKALETGFEIVKTLVTQGPAAAWQQILESLTNLKEMVIEQIKDYVKSKVVEIAVTKLLSMLSPAGAFIQAIIAIYNTIMFFIERIRQIAAVAASFIDSIATIASGNIGPAANRVESTMAGLLTLVISFLARFAGLGKVSDAVLKLIDKVRAPIDKGLDKVVAWIVAQARKLGKFIAQAGVPHDPNERLKLAARAAVPAARALKGKGKISAGMLQGVLNFLQVRYGLSLIQPFESKGQWMVRLKINPEIVTASGLIVVESDGKGAREQEGPAMGPIVEKLRQVNEMFKLWAKRGTAPVAQQMLRLVGNTMDMAISLAEDQKKGVVGLKPRFTALGTSLRSIQVLDPKYELVSIGQMTITLNQAKRQMPPLTLSYTIPPKYPTTHVHYVKYLGEAGRQLREQEAGVNAMVVSEWLSRRPAPGVALVRPPPEAAARKTYGARSGLKGTGMAAPHNPDQVLAGYIDPTGAPAIGAVNSFIGTQNRTNAQTLEAALRATSPAAHSVTQINVRLVI